MTRSNIFESFKSAYGDLLKEGRDQRVAALAEGRYELSRGSREFSASADGRMVTTKSAAAPTALVKEGQFQEILRPHYGKTGINPAEIGHHPDFRHLLNTANTEYCPITTMFMDMKGSTHLGLLHDPPTVYHIKNTFLSLAIEIVKSFDGHVHRLQGDAVMAYFGGKHVAPELGVIDGINCVSTLMQIVKLSIIPGLNEMYPGTTLGIRVGLDHGEREDVLWGCYGHKNMCEVTATSLYVDLAAKLQQAAGANQVMLGETLRAQLDLHDQLLAIKRYTRDGREIEQQFVEPNHAGRDGRPMDYRQHLLRDDVFFGISPLVPYAARFLPDTGTRLSPLVIKATSHYRQDGNSLGGVISCGTLVPKDRWLAFRIEPPGDAQFPCTVKFRVENHGGHALRDSGADRGSHRSLEKTVYDFGQLATLPPNWESTRWRGLHYLIAEIWRGSVVTHRGTFGVYVQ